MPPKWPGLTLAKQAVPSAAPAASSAAGGIGATNEGTGPTGPDRIAPLSGSAVACSAGGAGVSDSQAAHNLDRTALGGKISQYASPSLGVGNAADAALPASPSGEVEGNVASSQANEGISVSNRLESSSGWVVSGEGVVGGNCKNRWFVEVQVGGRWAKAAVLEVPLRRGSRVRVRLTWLSADKRDAEYEVVEVMPDVEIALQAPPVGFKAQGNEGVSHQVAKAPEPVKAEEEAAPAVGVEGLGADDYMARAREAIMAELMGRP